LTGAGGRKVGPIPDFSAETQKKFNWCLVTPIDRKTRRTLDLAYLPACGRAARKSEAKTVNYRFGIRWRPAMPRLKNANPKYRRHRGTGQAIVNLDGKAKVYYRHADGTPTSEISPLISRC
jgi:hypothetical protein